MLIRVATRGLLTSGLALFLSPDTEKKKISEASDLSTSMEQILGSLPGLLVPYTNCLSAYSKIYLRH